MHRYALATALNALRIVTGLLFWQHGAQKLLGWFGAQGTADPFTMFWWAGVLEFWGGALVAFGVLTRPVALILAGEMAVAYFRAHAPRGFWPIMNGGELAALYCFIYVFLAVRGGGAFSVDGWISAVRKRRRDAARPASSATG
jgi:putative oxidoreductase